MKPLLRAGAVGMALLALAACETMGQSTGAAVDVGPSSDAVDTSEMDGILLTLYQAGREAEASQEYDKAAAIYGRLFERRHDDPAVLTAFIRNMRYIGRSTEISDYVISRAPHLLGDKNVKFEYAKALLAAGRKDKALAALQEAQAQMPDDWRVYSALGIVYDGFGRFEDAIVEYGTALRLSPKNASVMNNLAMSQAMSGKLADAIKTLESAAGINRTNSHIRQNLALLYAINGDVERARALAAMDLGVGDLETNLSFYRRFEGAEP